MPRSPSESCEVVRATGQILEVSDERPLEHQTVGIEEQVSDAITDDRLDINDKAITRYNTMWFTDDQCHRRTPGPQDDDDEIESGDEAESRREARESCEPTLYVMLQTDEPCEVEGRSMKVYLRLSLNGIKQYDIPARRIEGLNDTFIVATIVPPGKNVALVQLVKTWRSDYTALEVAPNTHIVDIDRDTLLHVRWRQEMHKINMSPNQQVIFVLEGPSEPMNTTNTNMRCMECWQDDRLSQYVMQFPTTGTLVAVPVQPKEDSQESQLVRRVLSRESESEWDRVVDQTNTVHLSSLAHSNVLFSRWNDPNVLITEVELTTRGYQVDQTDPNIIQVLRGTTEMFLARNDVTPDNPASVTDLGLPTASSGDLFPPSEDSEAEMTEDTEDSSDTITATRDRFNANKKADLSLIPADDLVVGANVSIDGSKEEFVSSAYSNDVIQRENAIGDGLVNDNMSATTDESPGEDAIPEPDPDETSAIVDDDIPAHEESAPDATSPADVAIIVEHVAADGFNDSDSLPPMLCEDNDPSGSVAVQSDTMLLGGPELDNNVAASLSNESMPSMLNNKSASAVASVNINLATISPTAINDPTKIQASKERIQASQKLEIGSPTPEVQPDATKPKAADPIPEEADTGLRFDILHGGELTIADAKTPAKKPSKAKGFKRLFCGCRGSKHQDDN